MKRLTLALLLLCCFALPAYCLTPAEKVIIKHVQGLVERQRAELEDTRAKLVWTDAELKHIQPKIDTLGKERDQYKSNWEKDHEALLKSKAAILRRNMTILLLGLGLAFMIVWKFKLYRFIPGLGLAP